MSPISLQHELIRIGQILNRWQAEIRAVLLIASALTGLWLLTLSDLVFRYQRTGRLSAWLLLIVGGTAGFWYVITALRARRTLEGVAAWTTRTQARGGKGLPRLQYHFWVERNGAIKYCTDLRYSFWHDHGGYPSHHLSVVFAGRCDTTRPPRVQLEAAAHLTRWLLSEFVIDTVNGHREVSGGLTICPGWEHCEADFRESLSTPVSFAVQREVEMCVVQDLE